MSKIEEGELAVRLKTKITGGIGNHPEGTVLRNLSASAYNTLVHAGGHEPIAEGEEVDESVDASQTPDGTLPKRGAPAPVGKK